MPVFSHHQLISKVLAPAVQFWLRSQAEQIEDLQVTILGQNREILSGYIPQVDITGVGIVYQGLHLQDIALTGKNIRINLGQVIKGQPLRLLEDITVSGNVQLNQNGLQASLQSPLLRDGLREFLTTLVAPQFKDEQQFHFDQEQVDWQEILITPTQITLKGIVAIVEKKASPIEISAGLSLTSPQHICLSQLRIKGNQPGISLDRWKIDLGDQVQLETLTLAQGQLSLSGTIIVIPEEEAEGVMSNE